MELLVKINKKLEQRRAILNTIIQNVGIQNKILKSAQILAECLKLGGKIITAGNGGSASQSEHFSSEMTHLNPKEIFYTYLTLNITVSY